MVALRILCLLTDNQRGGKKSKTKVDKDKIIEYITRSFKVSTLSWLIFQL